MAERRVSVKFSAEVAGYSRAMDEASAATKKTKAAAEEAGKAQDQAGQAAQKAGAGAAAGAAQQEAATSGAVGSMKKLAASAKENEEAWNTAGTALVGFGTVGVAGLGATAKAAMDWESAWAGVTKTVDGTPAQLAEVETGLRNLAKTLPATHEEIAGVAEAAGQLGVARDDVVGFTQTMVDLSETTNLTADEAATSIAQISNVMGTMEREGSMGVQRFGATLVALGNDGASTEAEIVMMAQRIAGAAKLVGATEADLLAMANAMASVGIEAQLGGGVMSRVMQRMYGDVMEGGEGLETLASVAGVSAKDFATAFEADPVRAVDMMVKGLNGVKESGGNVIKTMSDLGIKGTEETSVILRLAGAGDLLSDSLDLGAEAWAANSALAEEAAKRYETTEAQVQIAWNNIKDAAIDAGAVLLPVIQTIAEGASGLAKAFGSLPAPVQGVVTVLGGVAGVGALAAGGFLLLFPKVMDTVSAFGKLSSKAPGAATALQKVGKGAGAALSIAAVGLAIAKIAESSYMDDIDTGMGRVSESLAKVAANGPGAASALDELFKDKSGGDLISDVENLEGALDRTFNKGAGQKFNDWAEGIVNGMSGFEGSSQILEGAWDRIDTGLSSLVSSGNAEEAAANFKQVQKAAEEQGISVEDVAALFPQYADALSSVSAEQALTADGAGAAADGIAEVGGAAQEAAVPLEEIIEALFALGMISMSSRDSTAAYHDSLRAMAEATAAAAEGTLGMGAVLNEAATDFDLTTEAGAAANAAFQDIAASGMADVEAKAREGMGQPELQANLQRTYDDLIVAANGMGIEGAAAEALARKVMGIPPNADTNAYFHDAAAKLGIQQLDQQLNDLDGKTVNTYVRNQITTVLETLRTGDTSAPAAPKPGDGVRLPSKATGGAIYGPGTGTSDTAGVFALSNGEHVLTARDVQQMGGQAAVYAFRAQLDAGVPAGFASAPAREYSAPAAFSSMGTASKTERHYHTHINAGPGLEQSYAQTIADRAVQRQQDLQIAYGTNR